MAANKVLVVGLDGAFFDIIRPLAATGEQPTLRRLIELGCHGSLRSVPNMSSPAAWPSFATGKNPGKHGLFWMTDLRPNSYEVQFLNGSRCKAAPLWQDIETRRPEGGNYVRINLLGRDPKESFSRAASMKRSGARSSRNFPSVVM